MAGPFVGRDVLVGMLAGLLVAFFHLLLLAATARVPPAAFRLPALEALASSAVFGMPCSSQFSTELQVRLL